MLHNHKLNAANSFDEQQWWDTIRAIVHAYESTPTEEEPARYNAMAEDRPRTTQYGFCRECGKEGHYERDCPDTKCNRCGERGHWAASCPTIRTRSPSPAAKRHQGEQSPRRTNSQQYGDNRRDRSGSPHRNQQPQLDYSQLARALAVEMEKTSNEPAAICQPQPTT